MERSRLEQLRNSLLTQELDAVIITNPKHVYYFTDFLCEPHERFLGVVIPADGEPVLIVPALDKEKAEQVSRVKRILTHTDTDNPYDVMKQPLSGKLRRVGLEKNHLTVSRFEAMAEALSAEQYIDIEKPIREMRLIKSSDEVARIKRAIDAVEKVLAAGLEKVKPGVTEQELVAELEYQMKRLGAEGPSFSTMVLAGEKSALPHGTPGERMVAHGELLLFDLGVALDGYTSDITRTFAIGDIDDKKKEIYETVLAANMTAINAIQPGKILASIDKAAREVIAAKGYGEYFMHRLGHGMGMDVHEYPSIHSENQDILRPGMVFTVEPGIYLPGVGGVRIEDDVLVTENGCEVLTRFPKALTVIG